MPINYPTSLDSFTNPAANDTLAAVPHHSQHSNANDAIRALETKVGIGASTPTLGQALVGTGTGSTAYSSRFTQIGVPYYLPQDYGVAVFNGGDDAPAIQGAINAAIAGHQGGIVPINAPTAKLTSAGLDFSGLAGLKFGLELRGMGTGTNNAGSGAATVIENSSGVTTIGAYGYASGAAGGAVSPITALRLRNFMIKGTADIGSAYHVDFDGVGDKFLVEDMEILHNGYTGNGVQIQNAMLGQGKLGRVRVYGNGTGHGFMLGCNNARGHVANSGNLTLEACGAVNVLTGYEAFGSGNLFNSVVFDNCKAVNSSDITDSRGFYLHSAYYMVLLAPHSERMAQAYHIDSGSNGTDIRAGLATYPTGTPTYSALTAAAIYINGRSSRLSVAVTSEFSVGGYFASSAFGNHLVIGDHNNTQPATVVSDNSTANSGNTWQITHINTGAKSNKQYGDQRFDTLTVEGATSVSSVTTSGTIDLGHASDTTLSRASAGVPAVEGHELYHATGTDVPISDGGTGASTASGARTNLGLQDSGTSMPGGPATGQRIYRTDSNLAFYFDGTRWLGEQLFSLPLGGTTLSASGTFAAEAPFPESMDKWIEAIEITSLVNSGGTALDGSNNWVANLTKYGSGGTATTVSAGVQTINTGTSDGTYRFITSTSIGALLGLTYSGFRLLWTKTGTPGSIVAFAVVRYRLVGT